MVLQYIYNMYTYTRSADFNAFAYTRIYNPPPHTHTYITHTHVHTGGITSMIQVSGACDVHGLYNLLLEAPHKVDILGICPNTYIYVYI